MRDWAKFAGFAAILAVALTFGILWALDYIHQNSEWTCKTESNTKQPNNEAEQFFICHLTQAQNLTRKARATDNNSSDHFLEGIKITDIFLATFTGLLVVVGGFQAYWLWGTVEATATLAAAAKESADAAIATERAYVFPGYDPITYSDQGNVTIPLVMTNVGKTPAVIKEVGYAFLNRNDLPVTGQENWEWTKIPYDWAITFGDRKSIRQLTSPYAGDNVFTCYIRYAEIFVPRKTPHITRMSMLVRPHLPDDERTSRVGGDVWNSWD